MMLLSPEDVIKRMVQVYRVHWASMLRYVGLMFALALLFIILLVVGIITIIGLSFTATDPENLKNLFSATSGSFIVFILLLAALMIIVNAWLEIAFLRTTSRAVLNHEKISIGSELKHSRSFIWRFIGLNIVMGLIMVAPFLVIALAWALLRSGGLLDPGSSSMVSAYIGLGLGVVYSVLHIMYFSIAFGFSKVGMSVENWAIKESLQKSMQWVKGKWWAIFGRLFAAGIVLAVPYYVFSLLAGIDGFVGIFFALLTGIYYIGFLIPMIMIPELVLYHNLKGDLPTHVPHQK